MNKISFHRTKNPKISRCLSDRGLAVQNLHMVRQALPEVLEKFQPDLLIYNAGSDPYVHDPLASFRLTMTDLAERDLMVVTLARQRRIPVAMVLSSQES